MSPPPPSRPHRLGFPGVLSDPTWKALFRREGTEAQVEWLPTVPTVPARGQQFVGVIGWHTAQGRARPRIRFRFLDGCQLLVPPPVAATSWLRSPAVRKCPSERPHSLPAGAWCLAQPC